MNQIILKGNLTRKPEIKTKGEKVSTNFTLAVNRNYSKDEVDFIFCVAYGKTAETICTYLDKGATILLSGSLQTYEKEGKTNYYISTDRVEFLSKPKKESEDTLDEDLPF